MITRKSEFFVVRHVFSKKTGRLLGCEEFTAFADYFLDPAEVAEDKRQVEDDWQESSGEEVIVAIQLVTRIAEVELELADDVIVRKTPL